MPIIRLNAYYNHRMRDEIKRLPRLKNTRLIFGDNAQRVGIGGQATIRDWVNCDGEKVALGIATKWAPHMSCEAFFSEDHIEEQARFISEDFKRILVALENEKYVFWPKNEVGTGGLALLDQRSPKAFELIQKLKRVLLANFPQNLDESLSTWRPFPDYFEHLND